MNHHCTVLAIEGKGVLIEGKSGSGKSSLALGLLELGQVRNMDIKLVCDDQAILARRSNTLIASAPESIQGKIEMFGLGICDVEFLQSVPVWLRAIMVDDEKIERMPETGRGTLLGVSLPQIDLPARHEQQAVRILLEFYVKNMQ